MKLKKYILAITCASFLFGCNDEFMERYPLDSVTDENFWHTENDLKLFVNNFYPKFFKGHGDGWSTSKYTAPLPVVGSPLAYGDCYSDNCVRTGNEYRELAGMNKIPTGAGTGGWNWSDIRGINFFLQRYKRAEISEVKKNLYAGEIYLFKALAYFEKVKFFGDVPWLTRDLNVDSEELYAPRTPRAEVMDSVLMCLNRAVDFLPEKGDEESGRLNRDVANFYKSRICLFEGTYRKYHKELKLDGTKFLQECVAACDALMGKYSLYTDNSGEPYWKMFTAYNFRDNNEVIWGRTYVEDEFGHAFQRYYDQNNKNRQAMGATRGLIDEYLCEDGRPIYLSGTEGNYELNPLFKGYGMWNELENRDPRLTQTVCRPGEHVTIYKAGIADINSNGITYPMVNYNQTKSTVTGYRVIKHWMGDMEEQDRVTRGLQAAIEGRYAEVLLNYAEAKYVLDGTLSQEIVDKTINALRKRAGFDFATYPTARLVVGSEPADPRLDKIYAEKLDYTVEPLLREIRRERRIELAMENKRYDDLMRWKAGKLLTVPMRGTKMTPEMINLFDGSFAKPKPELTAGEQRIAVKAIVGTDVFVDDEGFIICYPKSTYPNTIKGTLPWEDYRYLWPIPREEITMNGQLKQNPGWEEAEGNK